MGRTSHITSIRSSFPKQQPCAVCGAKSVEAHHEDYLKPFEVVWLCKKHHAQRHVELKRSKKDLNRVLSPRQVSKILGFGSLTITRWCREGKIEGHKMGRVWRITEQEVMRVLKEGLRDDRV
jgi:excisionase family DNA binding protein